MYPMILPKAKDTMVHPTSRPLWLGGAISVRYMESSIALMPTAIPITNLPITEKISTGATAMSTDPTQ